MRDIAFGSDMRFARLEGEYNITETAGFNITFAQAKISLRRSRNITNNFEFAHLILVIGLRLVKQLKCLYNRGIIKILKAVKTVQYYDLSSKKLHFIVTPEELRNILQDFHHVVVNTGVKKNYTESDPNDFFFTYDALYNKLKHGVKLVWNIDYDIAYFSTGITAHLENCIYEPTDRLSVPNFTEPCPFIDTFCFLPWNEQLSTSFTVTQFPENVCGLCLYFPTKIEYRSGNIKHSAGIADYTSLDDFDTYEAIVSRIKSITKPLKLDYNGKLRRTAVRISNEAKKDFNNFYFISSNNITVF